MKTCKLMFFLLALMFSFTKIYSHKISSIGFKNPICEGFDYSDLNMFSIRSKFEQIFEQYASMIVVYCIENEDKMQELQTKTNILGEMETASAIASIFLVQTGKSITIQLKVVDALTNRILGSADYAISTSLIRNLQNMEVAISNICLRVFENLGISLSSTQVAILRGERNIFELSSLEIIEQTKSMDAKIEALQGDYTAEVISDIRTIKEKRLYAEKLKRQELKYLQLGERENGKIEKQARKVEGSYRRDGIESRREARKEAVKEFFSPAWYFGINAGIQTFKFDIETSRVFLSVDIPIYPLFLGFEVASAKSSRRQYTKELSLSKKIEYLDTNIGARLGYRMLGVRQGWFSPYFYINGGVSVVDQDSYSISDFQDVKENIEGYLGASLGATFITKNGLFGLGYSFEYNVITKKLQHFIGFSIGVNIVREK